MRVLPDASILIAYLLHVGRQHRAVDLIVEAGLSGVFTFLLTSELFDEVREKVATKPYLMARITMDQASDLEAALRATGEVLAPLDAPPAPITRDPGDDYLLAYAAAGRADVLVTSDNDPLVLAGDMAPLRILSPAEFVRVLRVDGLV